MGLRLDIEEDGKRRAVEFTQPELTIGRGPDNVVVINDPRSSRHHCRISRTPQGLLLEDLGSRNGTLLNGSAVKKNFVKPGDEFRIGNTRFQLADEQLSGGQPASEPVAERKAAAAGGTDDGLLEEDVPPEEAEAEPSSLASTVSMRIDRGSTASPGSTVTGSTMTGSTVSSPLGRSTRMPRSSGTGLPAPSGSPDRAVPPSTEAYLEGLEGEHSGEKIVIQKTPFTLGRGRDCDFTLRDKRASGRHARIVRDASGFSIEDLGSTNGTAVNQKTVKRALLSPGVIVQIGNSSFRAQVPSVRGGAASGREAGAAGAESLPSGASPPTGEEFVKFDVDKFLARDRTQHPLAVLAVVGILAILGYFTVDITRRLLERQVADPVQEANRISQNWSFEELAEEKAAGAEGKVPGWRLQEGDQGRLEVTQDHAQLPGSRALRVIGSSNDDLCRATYRGEILLDAERSYRLEGYVLNQGAFAAGLLVEWLRVTGDGHVEVARAYSETARQDGEAVDVNQIVMAPATASHARVSCLVVGSGRATFDRISFSPDASSPERVVAGGKAPGAGANDAPEEGEKEAEKEAEKKLGKDLRALRVFQSGPEEDPVLVTLEREGIFSIQRRKKQLVPALWAGLSPERDLHAFGPRLVPVRSGAGELNPFLLEGEIPDEKEKRWVSLETTAGMSSGDVKLNWRTAASPEGQPAAGVCLYMEVRGGPSSVEVHGPDPGAPVGQAAPQGPRGLVREIVLGERDERVSLIFSEPVKLSSKRHPSDPGRSIWIAEGAASSTQPPASPTQPPAGIEVRVSHGSRHETEAAHAHALAAEEEFRAGRVGAAIERLTKLPQLFPEQKAEIRRAQERIDALKKEGSETLTALAAEVAELRRTPTPVIYEVVLARASQLKERYAGTAECAQAEKVLNEVRQFWDGLGSKKKDEERRSIYEKAREYFSKNQLSLAELYFRWVRDADPQSEAGREAEHTLRLIDGRRKRDLNIHLLEPSRP